jgi:methionyl aminopeptidase
MDMTAVKTTAEIEAMRISGHMLATILDHLKQKLEPGMSTKHLAEMASSELSGLGGKPAFLGYQGFPDVLCVSLNSEVVHGIPSPRRIVESGDIVSMDFGVIYNGMITDGAISVVAGAAKDKKIKQLLIETERALLAGIDVLCDGVPVGDIAAAIQEVLDKNKYGIVRDLVGHGVGHKLHEEPNIPNYGHRGRGPRLKSGMTIAIEPMATLGSHKVYVGDDNWTVLTLDSSLAAHFEHTVLITVDGAEILTRV